MTDVSFDHILVPTDFSVSAGHALGHAATLARAFDARLTLLHVLEPHFDEGALSYGIQPALAEYRERSEQAAMERLEEWGSRLQDLSYDILLKRGTPSLEIVRTVQEEGCDMIIMGSHGQTGFRHMLFGSTAERVVRRAPCPVLTVPTPTVSPIDPAS